MDNRRKHSKRVFAMLLAIIMCLSQAVTAAADEVSANETVSEENAVPEEALEETEEAAEAVPEETVSEEAAPEEPEEAVSGEAVPVETEPEEAAGGVSPEDYFRYTVVGDTATIDGLVNPESATGSLVIPDKIGGKTVTAISDGAFRNCSGFNGSLTIPNSVVTIGASAFNKCKNLSGTLTIPNSVVTIGEYAFYDCTGLTGDLTIPDSVTSIGVSAFYNCCNLDGNLRIGNGVETIDTTTFADCKKITGLTIGNNVKTIGVSAFQRCSSLSGNLTIPGKVTTIGINAFKDCSGLTGDLTIPNSVTSIGDTAFDGCKNLSTISNNSTQSMPVNWFWKNDDTVCFVSDNGVELHSGDTFSTGTYERKANPTGVSLNKTDLNLTVGSTETLTATVSPDNAYNKVTWTSSDTDIATVENGVVTAKNRGKTVITATTNEGGFTATCNVAVNMYGDLYYEVSGDEVIITGHKDGTGATGSIDIPDEIVGKPVTVISNNAFKGCANLHGTLTIPNSVVTIGNHAFDTCRFTGTLTIPNTVETIGDYAFNNCSGFSGVLSIPNSVVTIGDYAFNGCSGFSGDLSIPTSVVTIGQHAFCDCLGLTRTLMLGDHVKTIGKSAFEGCKFTDTLTIPDSVETIGDGAFYKCTGFTGLTIGNNVKTIGNNAFCFCSNLTGGLTIPNSVVTIGQSAFEQCTGFNGALTIGNKVETISNNAFKNCSGFKGPLTIGNKVETIGNYAFYGCTKFTGLTIGNKVETIGNDAFYGCSRLSGNLIIPNSVTMIGTGVFNGCSGFDGKLIIPDSVTTINAYTFSECTGFKGDLIIPNSVTTIKTEAFYGCTGFDGDLVIPDSVTMITNGVFKECTGFKGTLKIGKKVDSLASTAFNGLNYISKIENNSTQSLPVNCFWKETDTETFCFVSDNGAELHREDDFSTGTYERKIDTPPTGVSLNKTSLEVNVGTPETLIATVSPSNTYWDEVSWNSSDKTVATVSNGVVTGLKPGNTVITVTTVSGGLSANCTVTVKNIPVTGVTLDKSSLSMYPGETETLTATVTPAEASQAVKWFSSNEKVATVDNGKVTSVSPGSAVITVSTNNGGFTATCAVRVYTKATAHKVTFLTDDGKPYATQTIENGKQATDPGSPSKTGYIFIGWSDGTSIWNFTTPVNKDLTLTAKYKAEQAVVSENTGSGMDPVPVVSEPEKKGEKTAYKLYLVKGQTFTAGGKGWTTSDKSVATVAAKTGKITGKKTGTAEVANDTTAYTVYVAAPAVSKNSKTVTVLTGQSAEVGIELNEVSSTKDNYPVTWYSANPKVAAVNGGMVTGIAKGSTKVTAYIGGKAYSATVKVTDTCKAPSKIKENKAEFSMNPLQSFNVKFDSDVFTVKNAVWSGDGMKLVKNKNGKITGSENSVINITTAGKFTAIGPGTTTVTGTDKNSKTVTVTVTVVPISTKGMAYITKDKTDTIKFPKVTNSKADSWKSSNENAVKFATTKKDGKVKGVGCGMSNISCVYKRFTFTTPVYVEDPEMVFGGTAVKNKDKITMKVGEMKQFKVDKTYQTLNYKSSKQANVFVDENGFVYARKKGKATISTKINGTTYKFTVEVK